MKYQQYMICTKNLNLRIKTESVTDGSDATVFARAVSYPDIFAVKPDMYQFICSSSYRLGFYVKICLILMIILNETDIWTLLVCLHSNPELDVVSFLYKTTCSPTVKICVFYLCKSKP